MDKVRIYQEYDRWVKLAIEDNDIVEELKAIIGHDDEIADAFYRELEFGTGGLRGIIGAGTNRMNIYTVAKASQGLANYIKKQDSSGEWKIAISYDSRIKSDLFATIASEVFAANGISVFMFDELMPTPCLSFAVRQLGCLAGVMVTASHNPAKYNGYKVYGSDGCQITTGAANEILREIDSVDVFQDVNRIDFSAAFADGKIQYISEAVITAYVEAVKGQSMLTGNEKIDKNVAIVYSPLNGTGLKPVLQTLKESGYTNITVVQEQEQPNGNFPTCPYPNPEIKEAMELGIEYAKKYHAELLLATDPDCDRVGIAVKDTKGEYVLLSGNETGMLLLDYICSRRIANGNMPEDPIMMKTIVTIDMAERIAQSYGVRTINVLTGFKFIGEQIGMLESLGREDSYIFGFEESYGYLSGTYVRDKDGVNASFLICEMCAFYKSQGVSLWEKLQALYAKYGYCLNTQHSYAFEGVAGFQKMQGIMEVLRNQVSRIAEKDIVECLDYAEGLNGLPKSNVLKFVLKGDCSVVIRPSGTEPKMKVYISVSAESEEKAREEEKKIAENLAGYFV